MPAGRPPKPLSPTASKAAALGAEIRTLRAARGLTLQALARRIGYSAQHVSGTEHGRTAVSEAFIAAVDRALAADGRLLTLYPDVLMERARDRDKRASGRRGDATVDDDVRRRAFLELGLAAVLCGPEAAARALSEAEGDQIAYEWSRELFAAPDRQALLPGLAADLKQLAANGGPQRAIALLSSYVASIAVCGGHPALAARWWARARRAADASGDSHVAVEIAGQHAVHTLYGGAPVHALALANDAAALTHARCAGRMHALSAKVQALALLGRQRETRAALRDLEAAFERLPRDITREKIAAGGWAEERLHHTHSYVGAFGGIGGGEAARDAALALYSPAAWRGPAQVKLHRAASETDAADAVATLVALGEPQRNDRGIQLIAARVLAVCERERVAGVAELREVLSSA